MKPLTMSYSSVGLALHQPEHFGASVNLGEWGAAIGPRVWKREVFRLSHLLWFMLADPPEVGFPLDVRRPTTTTT